MHEIALAVERLSKWHGSVPALRNVSMSVRAGQVHGLVGGNGAGKSSLVKVLAGVLAGEAGGIIRVGSQETDVSQVTASWARDAGLRFVHQDLGVFPHLTVAENLLIGHGFPRSRFGRIQWVRAHALSRTAIGLVGVDIDPRQPMRTLSTADRTLVAIARALQDSDAHCRPDLGRPAELRNRRTLVLDEPTASLPLTESARLLEQVRALADRGHAVIMVTHRLEELVQLADYVTILRDGQNVGELSRSGTGDSAISETNMIRLISGSAVPAPTAESSRHRPISATKRDRPPILSARRISAGPLKDISFTLQEGEIVGVAGLLGSGRSHLLRVIAGLSHMQAGELILDGESYAPTSFRKAVMHGIGYIPADRASDAMFADLTVRENLTAGRLRPFLHGPSLSRAREREHAARLSTTFGVRCSSVQQPIATLSGGNQQKVVIARTFATAPRLLVLDEPSQGVDVTARADIHALVRRATAAGAGALVVSSDLEELAAISDRILVLRRGRLVAELVGEDINVPTIHRAAFTSLQETR